MSNDRHGMLRVLIIRMRTGTKQGRQAQELALIIHRAHRPIRYSHESSLRCENHMNAREEEVEWPCDEVRKLAMVLGVDLE